MTRYLCLIAVLGLVGLLVAWTPMGSSDMEIEKFKRMIIYAYERGNADGLCRGYEIVNPEGNKHPEFKSGDDFYRRNFK